MFRGSVRVRLEEGVMALKLTPYDGHKAKLVGEIQAEQQAIAEKVALLHSLTYCVEVSPDWMLKKELNDQLNKLKQAYYEV